MKTQDIAEHLSLATSTIRAWTAAEFKSYLSPTAQGGEGRTRNFTDQDARIIAFIASLKAQSTPSADIHSALKRLQAEEWVDLPPMPTAPAGVAPVSLIPREAAETAVTTQRSALLREIAILQDRITGLEQQLERVQDKREAERAENLRQREETLTRLIEAETELKLYREGRLKPPSE